MTGGIFQEIRIHDRITLMLMQDMLPRCMTTTFSKMESSERRSLAESSLRRMPAS